MKWAIIKEVIHSFRLDILLLQEIKLRSSSLPLVREIWGNSQCSWIALDADGNSGGILMCWNNKLYTIKDHLIGAFFVSVVIEDKANGSTWIISSVYGPTDSEIVSGAS